MSGGREWASEDPGNRPDRPPSAPTAAAARTGRLPPLRIAIGRQFDRCAKLGDLAPGTHRVRVNTTSHPKKKISKKKFKLKLPLSIFMGPFLLCVIQHPVAVLSITILLLVCDVLFVFVLPVCQYITFKNMYRSSRAAPHSKSSYVRYNLQY